MKKILLIMALIAPIMAMAQQRTTQGLTFCGIPFGLPTEEFKQKVDAKKTDGKFQAWAFDEIHYNVNPYPSADFAYSVEVRFGASRQYQGGFAEKAMLASLCAEYGKFEEFRNRDNELCKIWFLKNGLVIMSYSRLQGEVSYVVTIIDYAAIKKVGKAIQDIL